MINCNDLHFEMEILDSSEKAVDKGLRNSNFLRWMGLRTAVPME